MLNNIDNLLLNMSAGLLPVNLSLEECKLLTDNFGSNWFIELGYNDSDYERCFFDLTEV